MKLDASARFTFESWNEAPYSEGPGLPLESRTDDFQDLAAWRRISVRAIRLALVLRETIIVRWRSPTRPTSTSFAYDCTTVVSRPFTSV